MDKVNYNELGGFGVALDDFIKDGENVRDAFTGLMSSLNPTGSKFGSFVLSGCDVDWITPTVYAAGYICYQGEICKVAGGAVPTPTIAQVRKWILVDSIDTAGNRNDENGIPLTPWHIRTVAMVVGSVYVGEDYMHADINTNTFQSLIVNQVAQDNVAGDLAAFVTSLLPAAMAPYALKAQPAFRVVSASGQPAYYGAVEEVSSTKPLRFWIDSMGCVCLQGSVKATADSASEIIFLAPVGCRLLTDDVMRWVVYDEAGGYTVVTLAKSDNYFRIDNITNTHIYNLGSIRFRP